MPFAALLPLLGSLLSQAAEEFFDDDDKLAKIAKYANKVLERVPGYIESITNLFDGDKSKKLAPADYDAVIARIDAEDDRSTGLNEAAKQRDAQD